MENQSPEDKKNKIIVRKLLSAYCFYPVTKNYTLQLITLYLLHP